MKRTNIVNNNLPPSGNYVKGTYWSTHKCSKCGIIGIREDLPISNPCPICEAKIEEWFPRKWRPPIYKWKVKYFLRIIPIPYKHYIVNGSWITEETWF